MSSPITRRGACPSYMCAKDGSHGWTAGLWFLRRRLLVFELGTSLFGVTSMSFPCTRRGRGPPYMCAKDGCQGSTSGPRLLGCRLLVVELGAEVAAGRRAVKAIPAVSRNPALHVGVWVRVRAPWEQWEGTTIPRPDRGTPQLPVRQLEKGRTRRHYWIYVYDF